MLAFLPVCDYNTLCVCAARRLRPNVAFLFYQMGDCTMLIRISSDSTCDLNQDYIKAHNVLILPLYTIKDGVSFRDGVDITPADIFEHVAKGGDLCSTAANNVEDYHAAFASALESCDALIHIDISADFSSCYQNACVAAEDFPGRVFVVDSRNLSTGHGHVVCEAVKLAEAGGLGPAEIADSLRELAGRVDASFILDRLDYMRKGGRCSTVAALGANLLSLKPCIEVVDGKMRVGKKYRGKFEKVIVEYVKDRLKDREDLVHERIFITHTPVAEGVVEKVRAAIEECAQFDEIVETMAGCTISCHCGPGTLGILYIRSK